MSVTLRLFFILLFAVSVFQVGELQKPCFRSVRCFSTRCPPGFVQDTQSCSCGCKPESPPQRCPPACTKTCKYGFVYKNGCRLCKCKSGPGGSPPQRCPPACTKKCRYGFVYKNGCRLCKCKSRPGGPCRNRPCNIP